MKKRKYLIPGLIIVIVFVAAGFFLNSKTNFLQGSFIRSGQVNFLRRMADISLPPLALAENEVSCFSDGYKTKKDCIRVTKNIGQCKLYNKGVWMNDRDEDKKAGCFDEDCQSLSDIAHECLRDIYDPRPENINSCTTPHESEEKCMEANRNFGSCVVAKFALEGWKLDRDLDGKAGCRDSDCTKQFASLKRSCDLWESQREQAPAAPPAGPAPAPSPRSCARDSECGAGLVCNEDVCAPPPANPNLNNCIEYERSANDRRTIRRNDFQDGLQYQHRGRLYGYDANGNRQEVIESCLDRDGDGTYESVAEYYCGIGWNIEDMTANCSVVCRHLSGSEKTACEARAVCVDGACRQ